MGFLDALLSGGSLRLTRAEIEELIEELEQEGFEPMETVRTEDGIWRDVWFKVGYPDILVPETGDGLVYSDKGVPLTLSFLLNFIELTTGGTSFRR